MRYQNGKQYEGVFNGIAVTFVLHNFSPAIADEFNRQLAEAGRREYAKESEIKASRG